VEVRATNNGAEWSNMLHFVYTATEGGMGGEANSVENQLIQRQLSLLQQFVQACCGAGAEASVHALMAPNIGQQQRLFGAVLALILAGSGGTNHKGGALDLERQDAYGCTLMHYVCALRNSPALQLLLHANVDPMVADSQGMSATDWARAYRFHEGENLISRAMGVTTLPQPMAAVDAATGLPALTQPITAVPPQASEPDPLAQVLKQDDTGTVTSFDGQQLAQTLDSSAEWPGSSQIQPEQIQPGAGLLAMSGADSLMMQSLTSQGQPPPSSSSAMGAEPLARTRSLEQFLAPQPRSTAAPNNPEGQSRSLAGFLTAAAAHVEHGS